MSNIKITLSINARINEMLTTLSEKTGKTKSCLVEEGIAVLNEQYNFMAEKLELIVEEHGIENVMRMKSIIDIKYKEGE